LWKNNTIFSNSINIGSKNFFTAMESNISITLIITNYNYYIRRIIIGTRKESTDEKTSLNDALRTFGVEV